MRLLMVGDVIGNPGRAAVKTLVPELRQRERIDMVVANAENAAGGSGLTPAIVTELLNAGVDVITSGDHVFKKKEIEPIIPFQDRLLRPANYPAGTPGFGYTIFSLPTGVRVGVINVAGRVFMEALDCPFRAAEQALNAIKAETPIVVVDIHAEATSEKVALAWYLNGKASAVLGTHTHVQTADERLLPPQRYTAFIADVGMTGPVDSVIGRKVEQVLKRFLTHMPTRFDVAEGNVQLQGAIVDIDEQDGRAQGIRRIVACLPE